MSINPEYKNVGTCVKCSFDHVCLYEEELRTSESIGKPELRKYILKGAEDDLFKAIRQCLLNVWFETVKLKPKTAKKLAPHSKHIKFWADKRNPIVKRRTRLVQEGEGFLPFLLISVLEQLANFL
jgi:hypothetical protein